MSAGCIPVHDVKIRIFAKKVFDVTLLTIISFLNFIKKLTFSNFSYQQSTLLYDFEASKCREHKCVLQSKK